MRLLLLAVFTLLVVNCGTRKEEPRLVAPPPPIGQPKPNPKPPPLPKPEPRREPETLPMPRALTERYLQDSLYVAIEKDDAEAIDKWIEFGAPLTKRGLMGKFPLTYAVYRQRPRAVERLLRKGANVDERIPMARIRLAPSMERIITWYSRVSGKVDFQASLSKPEGSTKFLSTLLELSINHHHATLLESDLDKADKIMSHILDGKPFWTVEFIFEEGYQTPLDYAESIYEQRAEYAKRTASLKIPEILQEERDAREILALIRRYDGKKGMSREEVWKKTPPYDLYVQMVWKDGKLSKVKQTKDRPTEGIEK